MTQERRHELVDGEIVMMAGADRRHDRVVVNVLGSLSNQLRGRRCAANSADTAIRIPKGNIRYPDISVDCGNPDETSLVAHEPVVVIEVLCPSTRAFDREDKLKEYKSVPAIRHIVLIDPDEAAARVYTRTQDEEWRVEHVEGIEQTVALAAIDATISMADAYDRLAFKPRPRLVRVDG